MSFKSILIVLAIIALVSVAIYNPLLDMLKDEWLTVMVGGLLVFGFYYVFLRHFW